MSAVIPVYRSNGVVQLYSVTADFPQRTFRIPYHTENMGAKLWGHGKIVCSEDNAEKRGDYVYARTHTHTIMAKSGTISYYNVVSGK